jgi:hypothetical protein
LLEAYCGALICQRDAMRNYCVSITCTLNLKRQLSLMLVPAFSEIVGGRIFGNIWRIAARRTA